MQTFKVKEDSLLYQKFLRLLEFMQNEGLSLSYQNDEFVLHVNSNLDNNESIKDFIIFNKNGEDNDTFFPENDSEYSLRLYK